METVKYFDGKEYPIKFEYFREYVNNQIDNLEKDSKGGYSIAYLSKDCKETPCRFPYDVIIAAWASCSKQENFSRKLGRMVAAGRLKMYLSKNVDISPKAHRLRKYIISSEDILKNELSDADRFIEFVMDREAEYSEKKKVD